MYQSKIQSAETDRLFAAILSLKSVEDCYRFFEDLCTYGEIEAMAQRLEVAKLLTEGKTFTQISAATGISSATITRVNKCLNYGTGGYSKALAEMGKTPIEE